MKYVETNFIFWVGKIFMNILVYQGTHFLFCEKQIFLTLHSHFVLYSTLNSRCKYNTWLGMKNKAIFAKNLLPFMKITLSKKSSGIIKNRTSLRQLPSWKQTVVSVYLVPCREEILVPRFCPFGLYVIVWLGFLFLEWQTTGRHPTNPFTILEPQDQEIREFYVV